MSKRVLFLVDGFNLYHSLVDIQGVAKASVKWLDLRALCTSYLQAVRNEIGERVELSCIYYFSARPNHLAHRNPGVLTRFDTYMSALRSTDIKPILAQFKKKEVSCYRCKRTFDRYEEKETDVALGLKLIEALYHKECDTAVIISGDTDLIPALRTAQRLFPDIPLGIGFPFLRHSNELESVADYSFHLRQRNIQRAQFAKTIRLPDGTTLTKPSTW